MDWFTTMRGDMIKPKPNPVPRGRNGGRRPLPPRIYKNALRINLKWLSAHPETTIESALKMAHAS